ARCRGIEAAVVRDRSAGQLGAQRVQIGGQRDQSAPLQIIEYIGHAGDSSPSHATGRGRFTPPRRYKASELVDLGGKVLPGRLSGNVTASQVWLCSRRRLGSGCPGRRRVEAGIALFGPTVRLGSCPF